MKSAVRLPVAAAMLFLPLAAATLALPASAQVRVLVAQSGLGPTVPGAQHMVVRPAIERFVLRPAGRIEAGRELRFRLVGTPGAQVKLDIPGVIRNVEMDESRPGVYVAHYTVRRRDNLNAFGRAVATLRAGRLEVTARVDSRARIEDERPPVISNLTPAQGDRISERGRVHISARLSDDGSGVDPASVRLRINQRDVTAQARIDADEIDYRENLEPGRHNAELTVRDREGNTTTQAWTFVVVDRDRVAVDPQALPLQVTSHVNNAAVDALGGFVLQGRTGPHARVRVVVESVATVGGGVGVTQPVVDYVLEADGNGFFNARVQPRVLPIPGTRFEVRLTATTGNQIAEERLTLHPRRG